MRLRFLVTPLVLASVAVLACSSEPNETTTDEDRPLCPELTSAFRFPHGGDGHADPLGAKAAGQARAGRITRPEQIVQPEGARHRVRLGDLVLANDKLAVYIEAEGESDGYFPFGGEVLGIEPVDETGRPLGVSHYGESVLTLGLQTVAPDRVTVLADGSDGGAAVIRASGVLKTIPFLEAFRILSPNDYDLPVAVDYVLEPGAERVVVRLSVANTGNELIDFGIRQFLGFFHGSRNLPFTPGHGFAAPKGTSEFLAWSTDASGFAVKTLLAPLRTELEISGFQLYSTKGLAVDGCATKTVDYLEYVGGAPGLDGVLEARRRADGEPAWREVRGVVKEADGSGLPGALVHATAPDGRYLTRARADASGAFVLHLPPGATELTPTLQGWAMPAPTSVADGAATVELVLPKRATIEVLARDADTNEALPVRVQILPASPVAAPPDTFGVRTELDGRLWQEFAVTGRAVLPVPPGEHRVIVSRGFAYELHDEAVTAVAGATVTVDASLVRSVPADGSLCADFHVHSHYSADSSDPVDMKVKAAISDGLDIPVSSEHEYVIDFQPVIERLGLGRWAFGMPSEELTTFTWGHFGVVPLRPKPDQVNNGAIAWIGKKPAEVFAAVNALPESPAIIVNHPSGSDFSAYFGQAQLARATGKGTPELWSEDFAAIEVFNDSDLEENRAGSLEDWFALLNAGRTYWAVGNSDSHDERASPVGYPRTCLRLGTEDPRELTAEKVRDALKAGVSHVSGGFALAVTGPDGVAPGGTSRAGAYRVAIASPSWLTATKLEVFVDGVSTRTLDLAPLPPEPGARGKRYAATVDVVPVSSKPRHYVVFHVKGDGDLAPIHPKKRPFAVSNPIFF